MRPLNIKRRLFHVIPFFIAFIFILLKSLSFDVFGFSQSYLTNLWSFIFYFSVFNPAFLPIWSVFALGMFADVLLQIPFGISPIMYSFIYFIGQFYRRFLVRSSFGAQWGVYSILMTFLFIIGLILLKILYGIIPHVSYLTAEYISILILYPVIAALCGYFNRLIRRYE